MVPEVPEYTYVKRVFLQFLFFANADIPAGGGVHQSPYGEALVPGIKSSESISRALLKTLRSRFSHGHEAGEM